MTRKRDDLNVDHLPQHESGVRSLIAEAHGTTYVAHHTLAQAQADPNGVVIFEGDYGGQIYLVARTALIKCSEPQLRALLATLDSRAWDDPSGARVYFESLAEGAGVAGGMGGGVVPAEVWVHPELGISADGVRRFLLGEVTDLDDTVV